MNKFSKFRKILLINLGICFVLVEFVSCIAIELFSIARLPSFRNETMVNKYPKNADIDTVFGVWHIPSTSFRHVSKCFDVNNYYNSYGARDSERALTSDKARIVLLGDSFIEGYGVDTSERMSNYLEKYTQLEVLNFGTSGAFGTTQMNLQYQSMVTDFEHSCVVVGLLPFNDFNDDSYEFGIINYADRYRPYKVKDKDKYELVYHKEKIEDSSWNPVNMGEEFSSRIGMYDNTFKGRVKKFLRNYSYLYQILAHLNKAHVLELSSKYYNCSSDEMSLMLHNLEQLKRQADLNKAKLCILIIPHKSDILFAEKNKHLNPVLLKELNTFVEGKDILLLDLLVPFRNNNDYNDFYFDCDGHWSPKGNRFVAELLSKMLSKELTVK